MDGKYMRTVDYSDWESYSEDEPVPKQPEKKATVVIGEVKESSKTAKEEPKKKSKKEAAKGQKTLFNYFSKK